MQKISDDVQELWLRSHMSAPLNMTPTDWFVNRLVEQVEQILTTSYQGPLPQCSQAIEYSILKLREWVYSE